MSKQFLSRIHWKILHLHWFFYTTIGCDGCDKYEVCELWGFWFWFTLILSLMTKPLFCWEESNTQFWCPVLSENQFLQILISVDMPARPSIPQLRAFVKVDTHHPPTQSKCYACNRQSIRRNPYWQLPVGADSNTDQHHLDGWEIILLQDRLSTWKECSGRLESLRIGFNDITAWLDSARNHLKVKILLV